jgi:hypothetical protein
MAIQQNTFDVMGLTDKALQLVIYTAYWLTACYCYH